MSTICTPRPPVKANKPRKPQPRSAAVVVPINEHGCNGVVRLTVGKLATLYFVDKVPSDFGDGVKLTKVSDPEDAYHVHLSEEGHTCECLGFLAHSHCKHVSGLVALRLAGKV
jgi:hypothetical protein